MVLPQENKYTLADVLSWDETVRVEVIDGCPVMLAAPARIHQEISGELFGQLHTYLLGKPCKVYHAPFSVRLFEKSGDSPKDVRTVVEPDISVVCDPGKLDDIGCKGAPDLIIEILSPASRRHDRLTKFNLYRRAGVREYWIVDPASRDVQSFVLEDGYYCAKEYGTFKDAVRVSILEGCVLDLSQVLAE